MFTGNIEENADLTQIPDYTSMSFTIQYVGGAFC